MVLHYLYSGVCNSSYNIKKFAQIPQKHLTLVAVCMCINVPKRKCNGVKLGVWIISSRHKKYVPYNDVKAPLHKAMLAWLLFVTYQISVFLYGLNIFPGHYIFFEYQIPQYFKGQFQKELPYVKNDKMKVYWTTNKHWQIIFLRACPREKFSNHYKDVRLKKHPFE